MAGTNFEGQGLHVNLDIATERIEAGRSAGNQYTKDLESIRDALDAQDDAGTTLGTMVASQLSITEAETRYAVRSGIPNKASKAVKEAANGVKGA